MKKLISLFAAASLLASLSACGCSKDKANTGTADKTGDGTGVVNVEELTTTDISMIEGDSLAAAEPADEESQSAADIDEFYISIGDAKLVDSVDGKAIIIELEFKNNTSSKKSYDGIFNESVTQNGADLNGTTILEAIEGYNPLSANNLIKGGDSAKVQKVFALDDDESDVTISIFRYGEPERGTVTKTFKIK